MIAAYMAQVSWLELRVGSPLGAVLAVQINRLNFCNDTNIKPNVVT